MHTDDTSGTVRSTNSDTARSTEPGTVRSTNPGTVQTFPFRFWRRYQVLGLPFGIAPPTAWVRVSAAELVVRFGPWCVRSPRSNIASTTITGPYWLVKTAGPAHLSLADGGITCATNGERGLCVRFAEPVPGIEPLGVLRHPAVTVTVDDCPRLAALLAQPPERTEPDRDRPQRAARATGRAAAGRSSPDRSARPSGGRRRG